LFKTYVGGITYCLRQCKRVVYKLFRIVIEHLAKFHAVSYVMVQKAGIDEFKAKWEVNILEPFDSANHATFTMFDSGINSCINIIKVR